MANNVYDYYINQILQGNAPWSSSQVKIACCSSSYTPNFSSDQFLSNINPSHIIRTSGALSGKSVNGRVCDASDIVVFSITGIVDMARLVLYYDSGVSTTSVLICAIDTATGLPLTPDGRPVRIVWSNSGNKIFRI